MALVNVTVTDPYNRLVTGLEPDNFRVFKNSVVQEIQYFSSEDVRIFIGVIFDLSGSMANKIGKASEASFQFFKTANPKDEFILVSFNERAAHEHLHQQCCGSRLVVIDNVGHQPQLERAGEVNHTNRLVAKAVATHALFGRCTRP